jgi:hypothetical protein
MLAAVRALFAALSTRCFSILNRIASCFCSLKLCPTPDSIAWSCATDVFCADDSAVITAATNDHATFSFASLICFCFVERL